MRLINIVRITNHTRLPSHSIKQQAHSYSFTSVSKAYGPLLGPSYSRAFSTHKPIEQYTSAEKARIVCTALNAPDPRKELTWTLWTPGYQPIHTARVLGCVLNHGWYSSLTRVPRRYSGVNKTLRVRPL